MCVRNMAASGVKFNGDTGRWEIHEDNESEAEMDEDAGM